MIQVKIHPLKGIEISSVGNINLGQTKAEVEATLNLPKPIGNNRSVYCDEYELRVDFNSRELVSFIEFIYGPFPEKTELNLFGIDPFKLEANRLVNFLKEKNNDEVESKNGEYHYFFKNIGISVWRDATEQEVLKMIEKAKSEGKEYKEWMKEDLEKSKYFWTIAACLPDYYTK